MRPKLYLKIAIICLLIAGCNSSPSSGSKPRDIVKKYWELLESGKTDDVQQLFSKRQVTNLAKGEGISGWRGGVVKRPEEIKANGGIESISIENEIINRADAQVRAIVKLKGSKEELWLYSFVKEDGDEVGDWGKGDWKIDEMKLLPRQLPLSGIIRRPFVCSENCSDLKG